LEKLAKERPDLCDKVLAAIASGENLKRKKKKKENDDAEEDAGVDSIETIMDVASKIDSVDALVDLAFSLHNKKYTPCITFQLDSVRCQTLFYGMLKSIEDRENKKYPEYRSTLLKQQRGLEKLEKDKKGLVLFLSFCFVP